MEPPAAHMLKTFGFVHIYECSVLPLEKPVRKPGNAWETFIFVPICKFVASQLEIDPAKPGKAKPSLWKLWVMYVGKKKLLPCFTPTIAREFSI